MKFRIVGEASAPELELDIYDVVADSIFAVSARDVRAQLKRSQATTIRVRINSAGGEVTEGFAIYHLLSEHPARVEVQVDGLAGSIASVIAMAGDRITIAPTGFVMVHNPAAFLIKGESSDFRAVADLLDKMRDITVDVYQARTGQARDALMKLMDAETYMTAKEAKDLGFVDSIVEAKEQPERQQPTPMPQAALLAAIDRSLFNTVPENLRDSVIAAMAIHPPPVAASTQANNHPKHEKKSMALSKKTLELLGLQEGADDAAIERAVNELHTANTGNLALATRVSQLENRVETQTVESERERLIAEMSADGRLPPSMHDWAKTQTIANLKAFAQNATPRNPGAAQPGVGAVAGTGTAVQQGAAQQPITEPSHQSVSISLQAEELQVIEQLGITPTAYLEQKKLEMQRARLQGRV